MSDIDETPRSLRLDRLVRGAYEEARDFDWDLALGDVLPSVKRATGGRARKRIGVVLVAAAIIVVFFVPLPHVSLFTRISHHGTRPGGSVITSPNTTAPLPAGTLAYLAPAGIQTAWAVYDTDSDTSSGGELVLRTTDAGATWHDVTPPQLLALATPSNVANSLAFPPVVFLGAERAWTTVSEKLMATDDGGVSWHVIGRVPNCRLLQFVDATHGWCNEALVGQGISMTVDLYRTVDGGLHWQLVQKVGTPSSALKSGRLPYFCQKSFVFTTDTLGWAGLNCGGVTGEDRIYETTDGGLRWSARDIALPHSLANKVQGFEPPVVEGELGAGAGIGQSPLVIYRSQDGGRTWQVVVPPGKLQSLSIDIINPLQWRLAANQRILATDDAGRSWSTITPRWPVAVSNQKYGPPTVQFVNADTGWAQLFDSKTSTTVLLRTTDGGVHWTVRTPGAKSPSGFEGGSACKASQIEVGGFGSSGAAGKQVVTIRMENISSAPCSLKGYPMVVFRSSTGTVLKVSLSHAGFLWPSKPTEVILPPDKTASAGFIILSSGTQQTSAPCPTATSITTMLPGMTGSFAVSTAILVPGILLCAPNKTVYISPVVKPALLEVSPPVGTPIFSGANASSWWVTLAFANSRVGAVAEEIGNAQSTGSNCDLLVIETFDGGQDWTPPKVLSQTAPCATGGENGGVTDEMTMTPDGTWFLATPQGLYRGTTSGFRLLPAAYLVTTMPADSVCQLASSGKSVWVLLAWKCGQLASTTVLLHSDDDGANWVRRSVPLGLVVEGGLVTSAPDSLAVEGDETAWLLGWSNSARTRLAVARTTDGGRSWDATSLPCRGPERISGLLAASGNTLLALCLGEMYTGFGEMAVVTSDNGGQTWTQRCNNGPQGILPEVGACPEAGYPVKVAAMANGTLLVALDYIGEIDTSLDGGHVWKSGIRSYSSNVTLSQGTGAVWMLGSGFQSAGEGLEESTNGRGWRVVALP